MKAYIFYIATLLAALALPANGQTGSIATKAAPGAPAVPYKLSLVTTGNNNGTVAVEDNKPGGNGVITEGSDTLAYGASGSNATTVKLTVTPTTGYVVRKDYPKAYKTGDTGTTVTVNGTGSSYTFSMPAYPTTVAIAYANQLKEQTTQVITLKEKTKDEAEALRQLPRYIHFTLTSGREDSLKVADTNGWKYDKNANGNKDYSPLTGAVHTFTFTLAAALPDSIIDAQTPLLTNLSANVTVVNLVQPLQPEETTGKDLVISSGTGENLNEGEGAAKRPFNGTIESTTVKGLEVKDDVKDAILTLKGVTVADGGSAGTTTIKGTANGGASLILKIEGSNNLGELKIEQNATLVLNKVGDASLGTTTISNAGTFRDSTATVTQVKGDAALDINGNLAGGGTVEAGTPITLKATTNEGTGTITFTWQKKAANGSYTDIEGATKTYNDGTLTKAIAGITNEYQIAAATLGDAAEYRCLIQRTANTATTLLSTQPAKVEVEGGDTPTYTVTLPAVEVFILTPGAGSYTVEEGNDFTFTLTPPAGYTGGNTPAVSTSRGETLTPGESDGTYLIRNVREDITVSIAFFPTGIDPVETGGIRVWSTPGTLHIRTTEPTSADIYTLTGSRIRQISLSSGDNQTTLPSGLYLLFAGKQYQKVIVR